MLSSDMLIMLMTLMLSSDEKQGTENAAMLQYKIDACDATTNDPNADVYTYDFCVVVRTTVTVRMTLIVMKSFL